MKKRVEQPKHISSKILIDTQQRTVMEINTLVRDKAVQLQRIIQNTILSMNQYRKHDIFSNSESILCITSLSELFEKCGDIIVTVSNIPNVHIDTFTQSIGQPAPDSPLAQINSVIERLQQIIDKLSVIVSGFGTQRLEDLCYIAFGTNDTPITSSIWRSKMDILTKHTHPIGYKTVYWKNKTRPKELVTDPNPNLSLCCDKMGEDCVSSETANQYECFDIDISVKTVYVRINGIRVVIHNEKTQKTLIIQCIVDDLPLDCVSAEYINVRRAELLRNMPEQDATFDRTIMSRILETATLKDYLVYSNADMYKRHFAVLTEVNGLKVHKLDYTIKKFLELDICDQRQMLMNLLVYNKEEDIQYITYLLYNLITTNTMGTISDSVEQMIIYDSFPLKVKLFFKETMKNTMKYTKDMMHKYDINRITLEQQIFVMKVPENVKEKAVAKLKEIKGKSDDAGSKSKQYLEGLLKIPFGVYREEPILRKIKTINAGFITAIEKLCPLIPSELIVHRDKYNMLEIAQIIDTINSYLSKHAINDVKQLVSDLNTKHLNAVISVINGVYKSLHRKQTINTNRTKEEKHAYIFAFLEEFANNGYEYVSKVYDIASLQNNQSLVKTVNELDKTRTSIREIKDNLADITQILDDSIHGHAHAKSQILKIIGQWMNGEQSGYCFGFEGSPGIGKTSLAKKGLANCLKDEHGEQRPFAFIALGGSCNGSTLEGHSYTYVNSTWGRITDILMDTKCMNPIIYIDELDKVSKTEHGKEIVGILMHLIDTTQNDVFQDKYFSGIDLDLSKALFIFSYNDPNEIDRILLDRIHRIKFDNLSLEEKIVIVRKYILPEINRKMGFIRMNSTTGLSEETITITDELIEYLVCTFTFESGVRKLKEVLFDLFGEINIEFLKSGAEHVSDFNLPYILTEEEVRTKYLKKYNKITDKHIHESPHFGVINGLWASSYGKGGIIPIQTMYFPSTTFLELKLTGSQGDVMKESMTVAKTVAWGLLTHQQQMELSADFEKSKAQGLHVHCPDGATPKDGPSAGGAITLCIYSLLTKRAISNSVAMTGEITLHGDITEIGGLEEKILGGIKAGVKKFIYPARNSEEFNKFMEKYGDKKVVEGIQFVSVKHVTDAFEHVFV